MKKLILLTLITSLLLLGCKASPILQGGSHSLFYINTDTNAAGFHIWSRSASTPDVSTNYALRAETTSTIWQLPNNEPYGTVYVVTATPQLGTTNSDSIASNEGTNTFPSQPISLVAH